MCALCDRTYEMLFCMSEAGQTQPQQQGNKLPLDQSASAWSITACSYGRMRVDTD